jgi:type IV fimbrial biogenesis protein FimT
MLGTMMKTPIPHHRHRGFGLVELMVTISILAVLAWVAAPAMSGWIAKRRLSGAAQAVADQFQTARSEAMKRSTSIALTISPGGANWYVGVSNDGTACNSTATCMRYTSADVCAGCTLVGGNSTTTLIYTLRGITTSATGASVTLQAPGGQQLTVNTSAIGVVNLCTPSAHPTDGYPIC